MMNFIIDKICKCDFISNNNSYLCGITFDGKCFYVTDGNNKVVYVLDNCFKCIKSIETSKIYNSLSYDCYKNCFWATRLNDNRIYKLDNCFCEITSISLKDLVHRYGYIKGICVKDKNNLLICFYNSIIQINKKCDCTLIKISNHENEFTAITKSSNFIFTSSKSKKCFFLNKYSCDFTEYAIYSIPENYFITDMTVYHCKNKDILIILAVKDGKSYIFKCIFKKICVSDSLCIDCNDSCEHDLKYFCDNLCDCNVDYNTNIIQSIALIETALSHILNAEGEKIQKAVCFSNNICDLLKVNDSVNKTIKNVSHLEQLLLHKLELAKDDDFECKKQ